MNQAVLQDALRMFAGRMAEPQNISCKNRRGESLQLVCRRLSEADYEAVRAFELEIMAGIPNNEKENIYQPFDEPGLHKALVTGWAVGLYDADRLAAFLYVIPHPEVDHNVLMDVLEEAGLIGKEDANEDADGATGVADPGDVMIADCILVGQQYRGYGLQRALFYLADCMARQEGISRLCGTASPKNSHSIHNFEAAGYRCVAVKPKYRSVRCFFVKEIDS